MTGPRSLGRCGLLLGGAGAPLGVWCGTDDPFDDDVRAVVDRLPSRPEITTYEAGAAHTRVFWNDHTLDALPWLGGRL